jgi:large subunit ribosomal protein L23
MILTVEEIVKRPLITEKAERNREASRSFAFEVHRDATKIQVKQAVEKPNWKKAFVTLKDGETIALFEGTSA